MRWTTCGSGCQSWCSQPVQSESHGPFLRLVQVSDSRDGTDTRLTSQPSSQTISVPLQFPWPSPLVVGSQTWNCPADVHIRWPRSTQESRRSELDTSGMLNGQKALSKPQTTIVRSIDGGVLRACSSRTMRKHFKYRRM